MPFFNYRETNGEFKTVDDLKKVKGFGDKTVESLKDFIVLN
ncbi:ComEA family DNA-binding protein [Mammaliicoccus sciuri]|nr:helix-hairpin-helix domain-containing protein [Mammaliicoccus sciuri]